MRRYLTHVYQVGVSAASTLQTAQLPHVDGELHLRVDAAQDHEITFRREGDDSLGAGLDIPAVERERFGLDVGVMDEVGIVVDDGDVLAGSQRNIFRSEVPALLRDQVIEVRQVRDGAAGDSQRGYHAQQDRPRQLPFFAWQLHHLQSNAFSLDIEFGPVNGS